MRESENLNANSIPSSQPGALRKALSYYTIALLLCIGLAALAPRLGPHVAEIAMFTPLAAVLLMQFVLTRDGWTNAGWRTLGLYRAGLSGWALALALPLLALGLAYGVAWTTGAALFKAPDQAFGVASILDLLLSIIVVTLTVGLGEEIGWRGYLLPKLLALGPVRGMLLTGLAHGVWHLPIMLLTPYYHAEGSRLITVPLFLLTLCAAGVCYGYLWIITGSVWPAAIAHSTFNILWNRLNGMTDVHSPVAFEYLAGESGVVTLVAVSAVAAWCVYRLRIR